MKKILLMIVFIILVLPLFASSGDGLSFNINGFKLKITWSWQENIPSLYGRDGFPLILLMKDNYKKLSERNDQLWIDII